MSKGCDAPGPAHGSPGCRPTRCRGPAAPSVCHVRGLSPGPESRPFPPQPLAPPGPGAHSVGLVVHCHQQQPQEQKPPGASATALTRVLSARRPGRHCAFSRPLLFLWLVSSSSLLSSLLCSWALLAGSRDRSLAPLPAYRTPSRLILCRAWARALSPQPCTCGHDSQSSARCGQGPAVLPVTAQGP